MNKVLTLAVVALAGSCMANAQGRPGDWPSYGGNAQRTGWEKSDSRITPENVKDFQLVLKRKLENGQTGPLSLAPPVVIGMLISYRGFKELAFVAGSSGTLWSIDADLDRVFWERRLPGASANAKGACAGMVNATPALVPPVVFGGPRPRRTTSPAPGAKSGSQGPKPALGGGFGEPRSVFVLGSDGKIYRINSATGEDEIPPQDFLPANAKAGALTIAAGTMYATTNSGCSGAPNAVWATDLTTAEPTVASFPLGAVISPLAGFAMGLDGTVYVQTGAATGGAKPLANTLVALSANDLKKKGSLTMPAITGGKNNPNLNLTTPVVFSYKGKDLIASANPDGSLYLMDGDSLGSQDSTTPLYKTPPIAAAGGGIWGGLSSWEDKDGTRWVFAPVWGPLVSGMNAQGTNGDAPNGSIVAFKVVDQDGKPTLAQAWVSRDMDSPEPPVITSDHVFTVAAGKMTKDERPRGSTHATFYALDAATGKEVFSSKDQVTAPGNLTGLTLANARVYFTTADNTLYAFGIYLER